MSSKKVMTDKQHKKNTSSSSKIADHAKWLLVILLVVAGVVANVHYSNVSSAIRAAIGIVGFLVVLSLYFNTRSGLKAWSFIKGSQTEMRKVTWPTRPETMQMTMIVMIVLVVLSLVLWGIDGVFLWLVGLLTGQGG